MKDNIMTELRDLLVNLKCTKLTFPNNLPYFEFETYHLHISSAWRVIYEGQMLAGNDSDDSKKFKLTELLTGQRVKDVSVRGHFHDLCIEFDIGAIIETFADSEAFESWYINGPPPFRMIVAGPGTSWMD